MSELFNTPPRPQAPAVKTGRPAPLRDLLEAFISERKYAFWTPKDLFEAFPEHDRDKVRTHLRKMIRARDIKTSGEFRGAISQDSLLYTATIYKT